MNGSRPTILVADDDPDIRRLVQVVLERDGYDVVSASDGSEAIRVALDVVPQLLIMDVKMPELTGPEVLARLREHPPLRDVPVVILTASVGEDREAESLEAGASAFLTKPFQPQELSAPVARLLADASACADSPTVGT